VGTYRKNVWRNTFQGKPLRQKCKEHRKRYCDQCFTGPSYHLDVFETERMLTTEELAEKREFLDKFEKTWEAWLKMIFKNTLDMRLIIATPFGHIPVIRLLFGLVVDEVQTVVTPEQRAPILAELESAPEPLITELISHYLAYFMVGSLKYHNYYQNLEKTCNAVKALGPQYDVIMGIARKGLWLSFIFEAMGFPTLDFGFLRRYAISPGHDEPLIYPLGDIGLHHVQGKKILFLDNDFISGQTLNSAAEKFMGAGAKQIDVLVLDGSPEIFMSHYDKLSAECRNGLKILEGPRPPSEHMIEAAQHFDAVGEDALIVDPRANLNRDYITNYFAVNLNFSGDESGLDELVQRFKELGA